MKLFYSLLSVDLYRSIFSLRFFLSVCGVALVMFLTVFKLLSNDVLNLLGVGIGGSGTLILIVCILPIFPYATVYATEWEEQATGFWMVRTGIRNYSLCKIFASALTGFLTVAIGLLLFVLIMLVNMPLFSSSSTGDAYEVLLLSGSPVKYLFYFIAHHSFTGALIAVTALWVSTFVPNKFVAVAAPLVLSFVAQLITTTLDIPQYLKITTIVQGVYNAGSPASSLILKMVTVAVLCLLMGFGIVRQIRRRAWA